MNLGNPQRWNRIASRSVLLTGILLAMWVFASSDFPASVQSTAPLPEANAALAGPPVISTQNGVVDSTTFDPGRGIAGGAWVSVFGSNLAPVTRSWNSADFVGGKAPTQLEGVSVQINGKPGFISFLMRGADYGLSYDQINVLAPVDPAVGAVPVTVTTPIGTSAPFQVLKAAFSPALISFEPEGRKYLAATTGDGVEYIGKFELFGQSYLGRPVRPAHTNDVVVFYGSGFGNVDVSVPEGTIAPQAAKLTQKVAFFFGSSVATVEYAGLAPGMVGVYQFNVRVPTLGDGDVEVIADIGGVRTPAGRFLSITQVEYPAFDHGKYSHFKLSGKHVYIPCTGCHINSRFAGTPGACKACHMDNYQQTTAPNHAVEGFPVECQTCHVTSGFRPAAIGHRPGLFQLTGVHATLTCSACHASGQYKGLPTTCVSCHLKNYEAATNPDHVAAGFSQDCAACHKTNSFKGAALDHAKTSFPLTGAHAKLQCQSCHSNGQYNGLNTQCASCHLARYQATTNPNHVSGGYPTNCAVCHTTGSFRGALFDHSRARFQLTGAHSSLKCAACHVNDKYNLPTECASCHLSRYQSTKNPNHSAAGFPTNCVLCHNTTTFTGAAFDHSRSDFPLTGAHQRAQCGSCHSSGIYNGLPTACSTCHLSRYQGTKNPNHVSASFPTDCALCHSTSQWAGARFTHSFAGFSLTGAHTSLACSSCHSDNVYRGKNSACAACHLQRFNATASPNHAAAGFPTNCALCHNTSSFKGATFNHSSTSFPLAGAHALLACASCHSDNVYKGKTTACAGCHLPRFNSTTNPNHAAAGFPTNCALCHNTTSFKGAVFNHTYFPIYSGTHAGRWTSCATCHTSPNNFSDFSCLGCHTKASTDSHHSKVTGYVYASPSCYKCHPNGRS